MPADVCRLELDGCSVAENGGVVVPAGCVCSTVASVD